MGTLLRRSLSCFLPVLLLVGLCACGASGDASGSISSSGGDRESLELAQRLEETARMDAYRSVLLGKTEFISAGTKKSLDITRLKEEFTSEDLPIVAKKFTVLDLDRDNAPEVILSLAMDGGSNDYVGFEILCYREGGVYSYALWYRAFMDLKTNGSFAFSGGAEHYGFGTIEFSEMDYLVDSITYCEPNSDTDPESTSYFVNREPATEEEFLSAYDGFQKEENAAWYEFTPERVEAIFSDSRG